jgi:S-adenosylmethionine decarboxylase
MIGRHVIADLYGVAVDALDDAPRLTACLREAARRVDLTPVAEPVLHRFPGGGVTGFLLLAESHIAFHTYPEHGFIAVDIFSCGSGDPAEALATFQEALQPARCRVTTASRGTEAR